MFDPEKVGRYDFHYTGRITGPSSRGAYVESSEYDHLYELYRAAEAGREAYANGIMTMRQSSGL